MNEEIKSMKPGKHYAKELEIERVQEQFTIVYCFVMVVLVIACIASFGIYKWHNSVQEKAVETYKAELEAQKEVDSLARAEEMQAAMEQQKLEIETFAKLFEGVRRFNYSQDDLMTYGWCVYNRIDSQLYPNTFDEVIHQKDQWTAFSDENLMVDDYYRVAEKLVAERYSNGARPCTIDFLWAELGSDGIYLKNTVEPGKYGRTWHH